MVYCFRLVYDDKVIQCKNVLNEIIPLHKKRYSLFSLAFFQLNTMELRRFRELRLYPLGKQYAPKDFDFSNPLPLVPTKEKIWLPTCDNCAKRYNKSWGSNCLYGWLDECPDCHIDIHWRSNFNFVTIFRKE